MLETAADIVAEQGVDGLTMAALAEASDYATASLYTYFPSRSSLVAALQGRALGVLAEVARESVAVWDLALGLLPAEPGAHPQRRLTVAPEAGLLPRRGTDKSDAVGLALLARLWGFSRLFLAAPEHHPREFMLQQQLLVSSDAEEVADAALVVPVAMTVLEVPRQLLEHARTSGVLNGKAHSPGPLGDPVDVDLLRTLSWVTSLNGALLTDRLSTGLPTTGSLLGTDITGALLIGWGASPELVDRARQIANGLELPQAEPAAPKISIHDSGVPR